MFGNILCFKPYLVETVANVTMYWQLSSMIGAVARKRKLYISRGCAVFFLEEIKRKRLKVFNVH